MAEALNSFQIVGQEATIQSWETLLNSGRFGHAHILSGHSGVGKDALAFYVAASLNCKTGKRKACGVCQSCRQFLNLEHPALHLIFALPRRSASQTDPFAGIKEAEMTEINNELSKKVKWPYYHLQIEGANDIRISGIRQLRKNIYLANDPGTTRVVIILRAHKMNVEAANALLKILEEPPSNTVFLLTTEFPDRLPDTVRSRCALHHVPDLSWQLIKDTLIEKKGSDPMQSEICARMSMGDLATAHIYAEQDNTFWLDRIRATLNSLAANDFASIHRQVLIMNDKELQNDDTRQQFLSLLILLFRDVALRATEVETSLWAAQVQQINKLFPECDSRSAIQTIEKTKDALERKVHLQLALTALFFELRKYLRGKP
jgi:DNA polymerase-3 subunit delta'